MVYGSHYETRQERAGHSEDCDCPRCEPRCVHCDCPLRGTEWDLCEATPEARECGDCIYVIAEQWAPPTREQLEVRLATLRRFGYGSERRPVAELERRLGGAA